MRYFKFSSLMIGLLFLSLWSSCGESDMDRSGLATLQVRLIDGPGDYEAVLVDIIDVQIKYEDEDWESLDMVNPDTYDLLELTAGIDALLGETELPAGVLEEVRLILGDGNYLQIDGQMLSLDTPSGQQSGLKVKVDETLEEGLFYTLVLDFDAGRSIVEAGNSGKYILKPVIRASLQASDEPDTGGEISGTIIPAEGEFYLVLTPSVGDPISTYSNEAGAFLFSDLEPGIYSLEINPPAMSGLEINTIIDIEVEEGATTDLGEIDMNL